MAQTPCNAESRIQKALYALELQRGNGVFNIPELKGLLTGPPCDCAEAQID